MPMQKVSLFQAFEIPWRKPRAANSGESSKTANASGGSHDACPNIVYSLLKLGCDYNRTIAEQAIQKRQDQVANADDSRVKEALPIPNQRLPRWQLIWQAAAIAGDSELLDHNATSIRWGP